MRRRPDPREVVREAGGPELLDRLLHLDAVRSERARGRAPAHAPPARVGDAAPDYDVLVAGGGLSLLLAPALADLGLRVAVVDRGRAGTVHREWNASGPELAPLWESGLFSRAEVDRLVVARYRHGVCRWHGGGSWPVRGVLDHAVDAGPLLARVRRAAEARGVEFFDHREVTGQRAGPRTVAVRMEGAGGRGDTVTARLMVDARGAASPYAGADLVCPTVGGVLEGLAEGDAPDEVDPGVGDILVTTEDVEAGRQHIWEGFPGRPGETTVYLFYYALAGREGSLLELYARFFETRPRYKRGEARVVRPTFGYIPGWSRLTPPPRVPPRVALFGDAAARHSPLTYCGFGHMLRTFRPAARRVAEAVERLGHDADRHPGRAALLEDEPIHAGTGALSRLMSKPPPGGALNALLDAAFGTLYELGEEPYRDLLQDRLPADTFLEFLEATARKHPGVYRETAASLGAWRTLRWGAATKLEARRARRRHRDGAGPAPAEGGEPAAS